MYWNTENLEKVVKTCLKELNKVWYNKRDIYRTTENIVAFFMQLDNENYDDEYARHNILNMIYKLDRVDNNGFWRDIPVWYNKTVMEIEHYPRHPEYKGLKGIVTNIDEDGYFYGTWGDFPLEPYSCWVEVWNEGV